MIGMPDPVLITKKAEQQPAPAPAYEFHTTFNAQNRRFLLSLPAGKGESYFLDKRNGRILGKGTSKPNDFDGVEVYAHPMNRDEKDKEDTDRFLISISRLSKEEKSAINCISVPKSYGPRKDDWMNVTSPMPPNYQLNGEELRIKVGREIARFKVLDSSPAQDTILVKPI